jgi:hypothetical protein
MCCPTLRAPDWWESPRFQATSWLKPVPSKRLFRPRPSAGNANRWAASSISTGNTSKDKSKEPCMQKQQIVVLIIVILLLIPGCSKSEQIDEAENIWKALGITNYHITIKFFENFANGIETQRDVTVGNGHVINSSCISDKCPAFVLVDVYTVDDLFSVARGSTLASMGMFDEYKDCVEGIVFDETYGFPRSMRIDCPGAVDEEHSFQVISFEVLK